MTAVHHETPEARASYAADAHRAGLDRAVELLRQGRPGSALRTIAAATEHEMAVHGLSGLRLPIAPGMARLSAAHHLAAVSIPRRYEVVTVEHDEDTDPHLWPEQSSYGLALLEGYRAARKAGEL